MQVAPSFTSHRSILTDVDQQWLDRLAKVSPLTRFKADQRNYEETVVDFVYASAKIEGNTYDRIDTDNLLRFGVTAGGKRYSDAVMLVNLRNGFETVMNIAPADQRDLDDVCDLHKVLIRQRSYGLVNLEQQPNLIIRHRPAYLTTGSLQTRAST